MLEFHKTGKVRILAVFSPKRLKGAPEIPTAIELGFANQVGQLFVGVFAPSATPKPVVDQIAAANQKVMADAAFQKILIDSGLEPISDTPDRARHYIAEETARWVPVVKATGWSSRLPPRLRRDRRRTGQRRQAQRCVFVASAR